MKTTIDAAGRLVIPKSIRRRAGLGTGTEVEVRFVDGRVEVEPVSVPFTLVQEGLFLVLVPEAEVPPITVESVQETLDALRCERAPD